MRRYEHGVIEVAETLHGNRIGTRCDYFEPGKFDAMRDWLMWRLTEGWTPTTLGRPVTEIQYDDAVRALGFAAIAMASRE